MSFKAGDRVKLTKAHAAPKGTVGTVKHAYMNGNYRVRMTHNKDCKPLPFPFTIMSIHPALLEASDCAESTD